MVKMTNTSHSSTSFTAINPGVIRVGHLVEAQVGFCVIPYGRNKAAFVPKLRAVCILSRQVEEVRKRSHNPLSSFLNIPKGFQSGYD